MENISKGERNRIKREITSDKHKLKKLAKKRRRTVAQMALTLMGMVMGDYSTEEIAKQVQQTKDLYPPEEKAVIQKNCFDIMNELDEDDKKVIL